MSVSVCLSVKEVNWRIIANLGFKFWSKFTAHCHRGEGLSQQQHIALCQPLLGPLVKLLVSLQVVKDKVHHYTIFHQNQSNICRDIAFNVFTARGYAKRGICCRRVSVCVCVCLSHSGIVSKWLNIGSRKTTPHDSPMTLVFWRQRSWRNSNGITPYRGDKCR